MHCVNWSLLVMGFDQLLFSLSTVGNYSRREGGRGSSWSAQNSPRVTYNENRGGQSNFNKAPPSRQPSAGTIAKAEI